MNDVAWITAVHEAAHAVAAIRAGLDFENVSAEPDEAHELDGALYWTEIQDSGEIVMPPELLAVVSLAGPCAEARLRGQRFDRMFLGVAATDDREAVANVRIVPPNAGPNGMSRLMRAVLEDGVWKVERSDLTSLLAAAGVQCPPPPAR